MVLLACPQETMVPEKRFQMRWAAARGSVATCAAEFVPRYSSHP